MASYILALDQGTTSSRAIVFDKQGGIVGRGQYPFTQHYPLAGWVEHDPMEIWRTQAQAAADAIAGLPAGRHQPPGDHHHLGQDHRRADIQRHRVAVPPHGGAVRGAEAPGPQ